MKLHHMGETGMHQRPHTDKHGKDYMDAISRECEQMQYRTKHNANAIQVKHTPFRK